MSGIKETEYRIDIKRQKRIELAESIHAVRKECEGMQKVMTNVLKEFSEGLKATFQEDVIAANKWVEGKFDEYYEINENDDWESLEEAYKKILDIKNEGYDILNKLNEDLTEKAPEIEKKLKKECFDIESKLAGYNEMLVSWFGEECIKDIKNNIDKIQNFTKAKDYKKAEALTSELNNKLNLVLSEAKNLEEKHQIRVRVVNSLRQVAKEMNFEEKIKPKFEKPETEPMYKRSRIIYVVDTKDKGKIKFLISLDKISTDSEIFKDKCVGVFDEFSKILKKKYGISTEFRNKGQVPDTPIEDEGGAYLDENTRATQNQQT